MDFKVGQMVEVVNNDGMCASLGATAVVTKERYNFISADLIDVEWKTLYRNQMNGGYSSYHFKSLPRKNEQLLFTFMDE